MNTGSVKKRYIVTLLVNIAKVFTGIINATIVPISLGVANYGNFHFLLKTFKSIQIFLTLSSNSAFFTYSSKNTKSTNASIVFFGWAIIQFIIILLIIFGSIIFGFKEKLFPDQFNIYIIVIGILQWVNYVGSISIQFGETKAESVYVQKINLLSSLATTLINLILFLLNVLNLNTFIIVNYIGSLIIISFNYYYFLIKRKQNYFDRYQPEKIKETISYYVQFCAPLVVYGIFGFFSNIFDRWFLQITDGSVQQGYFSISFRWISIVMIFTTSVINIFWREVAYAYDNKDIELVKEIYFKSLKPIYFLSTFSAIFVFMNSEKLIRLFFNEEYYGAISVMKIMAFLPAFSAISQINSTFFYAVEKVKLHRNISIITMILGILLTYVLVAPTTLILSGFSLGSNGIAIKMIVISIILSTIQSFYILKMIKSTLSQWIQFQFLILLFFVSVGVLTNVIIDIFILNAILSIISFVIIYTTISGGILFIKPQLAGLTNVEILNYKNQFLKYFQNLK